jgi:hypothetical protein
MLQMFTCKLTDVVQLAVAQDRHNVREATNEEPMRELRAELDSGHQKFKNILCHLVSLLHAVALGTLREDHNLQNLVVRCPSFAASCLTVLKTMLISL